MGLDELRAEIERLIEIKKIAYRQLSHAADLPIRGQVQNRFMLEGRRVRVKEIPCDPFYMGVMAYCYGKPKKTYHASGQPRSYPYGVICGREWNISS